MTVQVQYFSCNCLGSVHDGSRGIAFIFGRSLIKKRLSTEFTNKISILCRAEAVGHETRDGSVIGGRNNTIKWLPKEYHLSNHLGLIYCDSLKQKH